MMFAPSALCLFWLVAYSIMGKGTRGFWMTIALILTCTAYHFCGANSVFSGSDPVEFRINFMVFQLITPCMIPVYMIYLHNLSSGFTEKKAADLWLIVPAIFFACEIMLSIILGGERTNAVFMSILNGERNINTFTDISERILFIIASYLFYACIGMELMLYLLWIGIRLSRIRQDETKFFDILSSKGKLTRLNKEYIFVTAIITFEFLRILIPISWFSHHAWAGSMMGAIGMALLFAIFINGLFAQKIVEKQASENPDPKPAAEQHLVEDDVEDVTGVEEAPEDNEETTDGDLNEVENEYYESPETPAKPERPIFNDADLKARFEAIMLDEQIFLTQGITLTDIAARLHSNKTYVSKLVNTNYNTTFPEYLNTLRIDYAEQYLLRHRDAKQIEIAKACGFPSASAFNNTFKKVTGQTPKVWLATKK